MCDTNFKPIQRDQVSLFAHKLTDRIPDDDLVFSIIQIVEMLDLSKLIQRYDQLGQNAYHPAMMLSILYYAYASGIFSSRKIAEAVKYDIRFMYVASMYNISFNRINEFRKENIDLLKEYFVQIVMLCDNLGMIPPGFISIDGTKLHASASRKKLLDKDALEKKLNMTQQQIDILFNTIEAINASEAQQELELSELRNPLDQLNAEKTRLLDFKEKLDNEQGQRRINLTDPDCREQKITGPGYNAQAAVHEANQVIVAADVVSDPNDYAQLLPMIDQIESNTVDSVSRSSKIAADAGYSTGYNCQQLGEQYCHIDAYIPSREHQHRDGKAWPLFHKSNFKFNPESMICSCPLEHQMSKQSITTRRGVKNILFKGTACTSCPAKFLCTEAERRSVRITMADKFVKQMDIKMDLFSGKKAMKIRRQTVETVFGQLKGNLGFTGFRLRGLVKVNGEFDLLCAAFNLKKIHKFLRKGNSSGVLALKITISSFGGSKMCLFVVFFQFRRKN